VAPISGETPVRSIRVPDERWEASQRIADERGENMSEYVNRLLEREIRRHPTGGDD
jgi:hypothetical protein